MHALMCWFFEFICSQDFVTPYSSDLAPSDFHLFPALRVVLGAKKFSNYEEVETFTQNYFANLGTQFVKISLEGR